MALTKISNEVIEQNLENYLKKALKAGSALSDLEISTYADAAGVNPVDGLGGSAGITASLNTSSPLSGDADLRIVKDASNRQGNGISIPFTIENRHLGKVLQITFDMELFSGTYATGDLRVSIIQDPTGTPVMLEPVGTSLELGIANQRMREIATFQTHVSITSYRLCIHVSSTSASAYTVDFANFKVWEQQQSLGAVITDWQSYTPNIIGCGTVSTVDFRWRRVGGSLELFGSFRTGTTTAVPIQIPLPNGLIPNLPNTANQTRNSVGIGTRAEYSSTVNSYNVIADNSLNYLTFGYLNAGSGSYDPLATFNCSSVFNTNDDIVVRAEVPIAGWGSNVAMSSDSGDGRIVAVKYNNTTSGATTSTTQPIFWGTREYDTHNAVTIGTAGSTYASGNSWKFIAPISGYYTVTISCATDSSPGGIAVWINNSRISYLTYVAASNGSGTFQLNAGDILDVRADVSTTTDSGTTRFISIERISAGSQVVASVETVACSYSLANGTFSSSTTIPINFSVRLFDTHGAVSTGATTWRFTAPMSGYYDVRTVFFNTLSSNFILYKNGNPFLGTFHYAFNTGMTSGQALIYLLSGEWIDIRNNNNGGTVAGVTNLSDPNGAVISINRIGL